MSPVTFPAENTRRQKRQDVKYRTTFDLPKSHVRAPKRHRLATCACRQHVKKLQARFLAAGLLRHLRRFQTYFCIIIFRLEPCRCFKSTVNLIFVKGEDPVSTASSHHGNGAYRIVWGLFQNRLFGINSGSC